MTPTYRLVDPTRATELERELAAVMLVTAALDTLSDIEGDEDAAGELRDALNTLVEDLGIEDPAIGNRADDDYVIAVAREALEERIREES
jgi:hypothetical protein